MWKGMSGGPIRRTSRTQSTCDNKILWIYPFFFLFSFLLMEELVSRIGRQESAFCQQAISFFSLSYLPSSLLRRCTRHF